MSLHRWLQDLRSALTLGLRPHGRRPRHQSVTRRPSLEALEDRTVMAYAVTNLGTLGGYSTQATDLNEAGQVVGSSEVAGRTRAFLWDNGAMIDLGTLGGTSSSADGINDLGQVVGSASLPGNTGAHAFLITPQGGEWFRDNDLDGRNDLMVDLGTLPGSAYSDALDINNAGQVVGRSGINAFLWDAASGMTDLGEGTPTAINEVGQVTGYVTQFTFPFLWDAVNGMTFLDPGPGYFGGAGEGINNAGEITGYLWAEDGGHQVAFLWSGGYVQLGDAGIAMGWEPAVLSSGADVNNSGQVVGTIVYDMYGDGDYTPHAFLWGATSGMVFLPWWSAQAINDSGVIVVSFGSASSYLLTPVPEDTPAIQIADAPAVTEGHVGTRTASFTVTLSAASTQPVTVAYATANGTAAAGSDYQATAGTLMIPAGQTTAAITVLVNGDRLPEAAESFSVNLSSPTGATIADGQAVGTIHDDEPRISISDVSKKEGKKGQTTLFIFTVTLSAAYDRPVTMSFQTVNGTAKTSDNDYVARTGTLTFAPGQTTKTITIEVKGDSKREANETFYLDLFGLSSNASFTNRRGIGTILNDD